MGAFIAMPGSSSALVKKSSLGKLSKADRVQLDAPALPAPVRLKMVNPVFESLAPFMPQVSFADAISTFDGTCTNAKVSWDLGETVCARVSGPLSSSRLLRRVQLVNPDGFVVDSRDLTTNPQSITFSLPAAPTETLLGFLPDGQSLVTDNRGTWHIDLVDTADAAVRLSASITVHDPARSVADLQISKSLTGDTQAVAGSNIQSVIWVFNSGPDTAQNVSFTDVPPANTTFQSLTQTTGPTFTCTTPAANSTGTSVCTRPSLAKGEAAGFIITYKVNTSVANATELTSSASVSSDTAERSANNNSSDESISASNPSPPNCTVTCPSNVTKNNDPGQAGAIVTYNDPSTSGTCGDVTTDHPSGSFFPIGTTVVTTNIADGSANGVSCSFTVTVNDTRAVAVTLNGSPEMTVECRTGFTDPGATATDNAPITTVITVPSGLVDSNGDPINPVTVSAVDPNAPNTYTITYSATIGSNTATATRTVHVVDTTPPVITLTGTAGLTSESAQVTVMNDDGTTSTVTETIFVGTVECHTSFAPPTPSATDGCDNHAVTVTTTGAVDVNTPGVYEIVYAATDAAGNDGDRRVRVTVVDTTPPVITISPGPTTVECHSSFSDPVATALDGCAGTVPVNVNGSVNPNVPGVYTINYSATDAAGNTASASRTVSVVDTIAPTITLTGANPMTVECHTSFTDPGATANDGCAGNLTSAISATGSVNANVPGTYTRTYTVSDGTNTTTVTRTVNVVDTIPPTINLNGQNISFWPPNHSYKTVNVTDLVASVTDSCDTTLAVSSVVISKVTSDETENGDGDGNTFNDIIIASGCKSVQLRAERNGSGNGRVYTITFKVQDASGNVTTATATVKVPKNANGVAVDDGPRYTVNGNCP
jgi:uncharacterized repeat protein (TIGR01451 family)